MFFKNEEQEGKQVLSRDGYQWEEGGHKGRVKKDECSESIFVFMYKNKTIKPVEIVLRRGKGNEGDRWRG
jgi:hypothetical protein